jgi:hypothetical protein
MWNREIWGAFNNIGDWHVGGNAIVLQKGKLAEYFPEIDKKYTGLQVTIKINTRLPKLYSPDKYIIKNSRNIRSTNSLVDFLYVAEGKFGGCINLYTRVWDISALGLIISCIGRAPQEASNAATTIAIVLQFFTGMYFPIDYLPNYMQQIGRIIPMTYAAQSIRSIMIRNATLSDLLIPITTLIISAAILYGIGVLLYKRWVEK